MVGWWLEAWSGYVPVEILPYWIQVGVVGAMGHGLWAAVTMMPRHMILASSLMPVAAIAPQRPRRRVLEVTMRCIAVVFARG